MSANSQEVIVKRRRRRREREAYDSYGAYSRISIIGTMFADLVGWEALARTSLIAAGASAWPLVGITLMAYPITYAPWTLIGRGLRELMCQSHPFARMASILLFNASMTFLTGFIGLAIVTSFTAIAFNPFTLPCLIGVAVAGAVVFAAAVAVALRMRYVAPNARENAHNFSKELGHALHPRSSRVFNYHKVEPNQSGFYVRPFGITEQVDKGRHIYSIFGKIGPRQAIAVSRGDNDKKELLVRDVTPV